MTGTVTFSGADMTDSATPDVTSDTTDLFEIIRTTRSMRRLKPDPVPNELIRKILEAGVSAPSGGNMQGWRFLVMRSEGQGGGRGLLQACLGRAGGPTLSVG